MDQPWIWDPDILYIEQSPESMDQFPTAIKIETGEFGTQAAELPVAMT